MQHNIVEIKNKLAEIAEIILETDFKEMNSQGIFSGTSGIALFCFLYYKETGIQAYWDKGMDLMNQGIKNTANGSITSICNGLSGLAWSCHFLFEAGILDMDDADFFNVADDYVYKSMIYGLSRNDIDFLHGSIGLGFYFVKRFKEKKSTEKYLQDCASMLQRLSVNDTQGRKWIFRNEDFPDARASNLSLSHGMSSIIILLSKIHILTNHQNETLLTTIRESVDFLIRQRYPDQRRSIFPSWELNIDQTNYSRLGWCYGDLGIALAIFHAAIALEDQTMKQYSIDCFLHSAKRMDLKQDFVWDGGICHGTAGIALIFMRMYKNTGVIEFKNAYDFWIQKTLDMDYHQDGLAGYKSMEKNGYKNEHIMLTGISGIGLALLSAVSKEDQYWDECLLLT